MAVGDGHGFTTGQTCRRKLDGLLYMSGFEGGSYGDLGLCNVISGLFWLPDDDMGWGGGHDAVS